MVSYTHRFITSFVFTITVETILLFLLVRFVFKIKKSRISAKEIIFAGFFASFATIPYVWFVFPYLAQWPRGVSIIYSEAFAFIVEALFYNLFLKLDAKKSVMVSAICNLSSFSLGRLLRFLGIWFYW